MDIDPTTLDQARNYVAEHPEDGDPELIRRCRETVQGRPAWAPSPTRPSPFADLTWSLDDTGTPEREGLASGEPRPRPEMLWATNDGDGARYCQAEDGRMVDVPGESIEMTRLHASFYGLIEEVDDAGRHIWFKPEGPKPPAP